MLVIIIDDDVEAMNDDEALIMMTRNDVRFDISPEQRGRAGPSCNLEIRFHKMQLLIENILRI